MINFISSFKKNIKYLELVGDSDDEYFVEFINIENNEIEYFTNLKTNHWSELKTESDILIRVTLNKDVVYERKKEVKFNKVYIKFGTNALGDSIAWIPYIEEYRKKNNIKVILYTQYNHIFDKVYPEIEFTNISEPIFSDIDLKFNIDYGSKFYQINKKISPEQWRNNNKKYDNLVDDFDYSKISLQSAASLILGLEDKEIKPEVNIPEETTKIKGKYVVVAMQSSAQLKYWNNPFGWERVFDFLGRNGYKIVLIDRFKNFGIPGSYNQAPKSKYVIDKTGNRPLSERVVDIKYADMVITISSGLAWLSWAVGTPVVMISGFTKPWYEFKTNIIRIHNPNVCNGCWNDTTINYYDINNWLFCPKNMDFICSKSIQPKDVINEIKKIIK